MVRSTIDRTNGVLRFEYPERSGFKNEEVRFDNNRTAMGLWRLRMRSYVMTTLMRYKRQRTHALAEVMTPQRQFAIQEITEVLLSDYEGRDLTYFLMQVMKLSRHVAEIAPNPNSKYREHYETVILPMYHWINFYLRNTKKR